MFYVDNDSCTHFKVIAAQLKSYISLNKSYPGSINTNNGNQLKTKTPLRLSRRKGERFLLKNQ
jgi:hypothetical protein